MTDQDQTPEEAQQTGSTQEEVEEARKEQGHPGKVPGEGSGPAQAQPGGGSDPDSAAIGDGPSGGAPTEGGEEGDSSATGAGPSGGA